MVGLLIPIAKVRTYFHSAKYLCKKNENRSRLSIFFFNSDGLCDSRIHLYQESLSPQDNLHKTQIPHYHYIR